MPEYTPEREAFVRKAKFLEQQAGEGRDWGAFLIVDLDTGYAHRQHHDARLDGQLAWPITKAPTRAARLIKRWDAAVKRRAAEQRKAEREKETDAKP
jgi:hypothetical protein